MTHAQQDNLREVLRDLESLNNHTAFFLFDKINFLMDAVMGLINLQQNKIIKIFSIAAVVFLPPTVIASIYGMNFNAMPELHWQLGYPFAIVLMILSGIAPYWFFQAQRLVVIWSAHAVRCGLATEWLVFLPSRPHLCLTLFLRWVLPMTVPHLTTALSGPLLDLERRILLAQPEIEHWLRNQWQESTPPFYGRWICATPVTSWLRWI